LIFILVTKNQFINILKESIADAQQKRIDEFLQEFHDFDVKHAKTRVKSLESQVAELHRHVQNELFNDANNQSIVTRRFYKMQSELEELKSKILRYEQEKPIIDCLAVSHPKHIFKKHGKLVS
jgi:hypothetical protein